MTVTPLTPTEVGRLRSGNYSIDALDRLMMVLHLLGENGGEALSIGQIADAVFSEDPEATDWPVMELCALGLVVRAGWLFRSAR